MYRFIECVVFPFSIRNLYLLQYHGFGFQRVGSFLRKEIAHSRMPLALNELSVTIWRSSVQHSYWESGTRQEIRGMETESLLSRCSTLI